MITRYSVKDTPNISGALNNCALNCALPTLFAKINQISKSEIPATDNFKLFKTVFEEWYKFQEPISWLRFSELISKHNFPENQLIFAPILRQFIRAKGARDELWCIRQDTGRYSMLDSEDANQYFFRHFDFFMQQHHTNPDFIVQAELGHQAIQVYHRDAHFELKPIANITLAPEENRFRKILEKITGNASREATSEALIQLQQALTNNRFFTRNNLIIAGTVTLSICVIVTAFALAIPIAYALGALAALAIVALIVLAIKNYCETPKAPLDLCVSNAG